jgi:glycyl-tRNA synthetase beta chain
VGGVQAIEDAALLDEVTALVERPNVLVGQFDEAFLAVPQECLVLTMKANQRYFPLVDAAGRLTQPFPAGLQPDAGRPLGHHRRQRARGAAATGRRASSSTSRTAGCRWPRAAKGLDEVVYHDRLGSQGERSRRVEAIAVAIVGQLRMATVPYTVEARDSSTCWRARCARRRVWPRPTC